MDQCSKNKVKLFRTLKVVFYCLGLPLFLFAVIITAATEYVGEFAYVGMAESELFASMRVLFNGSALYGLWVAAGVWLLIAIAHIIAVKTVKNRRARTLIVGVVALVTMLLPVVVMDLAIPVTLESIQAEMPEGVTLASYDDEKGHFYTRTSASWTPSGKYESNNYYFTTGVENFLNTYKIGMFGGTKSGTANNTDNTPVTFGELFIEGEGRPFANEPYADRLVKADTTVTVGGKSATVSTSGGKLKVNDRVFDGYYLGSTNSLWYRQSASAEMKDGVYGYASYNTNGTFSDGYVFGIDVALEILEDYYYSQKRMTEISNEFTLDGKSLPSNAEIVAEATKAREEYYNSLPDTSYEKYLWETRDTRAAEHSLTADELKEVLNALGVAIGESALGQGLKKLLGSFLPGLINTLKPYPSKEAAIGFSVDIDANTTLVICIAEDEAIGGEVLTIKLSGATFGDQEYALGLDSRLLGGLSELLDGLITNSDSADLAKYKDLGDRATAQLLYDAINGGGDGTIGTVGTIVGLVGGLIGIVGDITNLIAIDVDADGNVTTTTEEMLYGTIGNLLGGLYWYNDSQIKPVWDFYGEAMVALGYDKESKDKEDALAFEYAEQLKSYDMSVSEGGMHGYLIGSVLIPGSSLIAGDTLGDGSYYATVPASYEEVVQFKTELSYKKWLYPMLGVRECLVCFLPFVVLFILLSGVAAEKEMLYATGQETAKKSKKQMKKEEEEAANAANDAVNAAGQGIPEEGDAPLVRDEYDKEVL